MADAQVESKVHGLGHSRKRVEDARFIRGQGNYIDDFKLPGMLHLDIVRSPYAPPMDPELERLMQRHGIPLHSSTVLAKA